MKKIGIVFMITLCMGLSFLPQRSAAQSEELQQLALNLEKLNQFREILTKMYQGYKILHDGYFKIKEITSGNYKLHQVFLDGLFLVSPSVRKYQRIPDIIALQVSLLKEYKAAYANFRESGQFSEKELADLFGVYKNLVEQSGQHLEELMMIITSGTLRMSDSERLEGIDRIYNSMGEKMSFLRDFNRQYGILAMHRAKDSKDIGTLKKLYDLK